jgi:hypothetical protein
VTFSQIVKFCEKIRLVRLQRAQERSSAGRAAFLSLGRARLFFKFRLDFGPFSCVTLNLLCQPVVRVTKMPLHRLFRSFWVAGSKGLDDRLVFGNRLLSRADVFKMLSELEA